MGLTRESGVSVDVHGGKGTMSEELNYFSLTWYAFQISPLEGSNVSEEIQCPWREIGS